VIGGGTVSLFKFPTLNGFEFSIKHSLSKIKTEKTAEDPHIHNACEIYVNLSGNVSFMVENNIYPVKRGEAIITRPNEYHHCIYHSDTEHEHYWILFSSQGNEDLLKPFFDRKPGEKNRITLPEGGGDMLIELCENLLLKADDDISFIIEFWRLIKMLSDGTAKKGDSHRNIPQKLKKILDVIEKRLSEEINVNELAKENNVSINTLERWFKEELGMSPKEFITVKRLNKAALFLRNSSNVQEAGFDSGFNDISYFIKKFKHYYGITPYKYSKSFSNTDKYGLIP